LAICFTLLRLQMSDRDQLLSFGFAPALM